MSLAEAALVLAERLCSAKHPGRNRVIPALCRLFPRWNRLLPIDLDVFFAAAIGD